jgi:hypothetical protein
MVTDSAVVEFMKEIKQSYWKVDATTLSNVKASYVDWFCYASWKTSNGLHVML